MNSRIIIHNRSPIPDALALRLVQKVIEEGRISNQGEGPSYCAGSSFKIEDLPGEALVFAQRNKGSDRFDIIYKENGQET